MIVYSSVLRYFIFCTHQNFFFARVSGAVSSRASHVFFITVVSGAVVHAQLAVGYYIAIRRHHG